MDTADTDCARPSLESVRTAPVVRTGFADHRCPAADYMVRVDPIPAHACWVEVEEAADMAVHIDIEEEEEIVAAASAEHTGLNWHRNSHRNSFRREPELRNSGRDTFVAYLLFSLRHPFSTHPRYSIIQLFVNELSI